VLDESILIGVNFVSCDNGNNQPHGKEVALLLDLISRK